MRSENKSFICSRVGPVASKSVKCTLARQLLRSQAGSLNRFARSACLGLPVPISVGVVAVSMLGFQRPTKCCRMYGPEKKVPTFVLFIAVMSKLDLPFAILCLEKSRLWDRPSCSLTIISMLVKLPCCRSKGANIIQCWTIWCWQPTSRKKWASPPDPSTWPKDNWEEHGWDEEVNCHACDAYLGPLQLWPTAANRGYSPCENNQQWQPC